MSGALDLAKELGLSNEDLIERVVDRCVEKVLLSVGYDEDGETETAPTQFAKKLKEATMARIDKAIEDIAARHVLPNVTGYLEAITLQETTKWGEKKGEPVSFIEYLVQRAEAYMLEKVSYSGKSKGEDSYNWSGAQTRITYLIHQHLHYTIETAMKQVLADGNKILVKGLQETAKLKLAELSEKLKVEVKS